MNNSIQNSEKKYFVFLILFMLIFGVVGWLTVGSVPGPSQDDAGFQRISYHYVQTGRAVDLFHPESSLMPLEYGRLFMLISGTISNMFGITLSNVRILSLISLLVSILVLFFMIRRLGENNLISLGLTIAIASSLNFVVFREARPEALGMLVILIIFLLMLNKLERKELMIVLLLSFLFIHIHLSYLIFAFAFCLIPFLSREYPRYSLYIFFAVCLSGVLWIALLFSEYSSLAFLQKFILF